MNLFRCVLPFPYDRFANKIEYLDYLGLGISFESLLLNILYIVFFNFDLEDYIEDCIDSIFSEHVDNDTLSTAITFFCEFSEELTNYFEYAVSSVNVIFDDIRNLSIDPRGNLICFEAECYNG